jgi:hypothetical protein
MDNSKERVKIQIDAIIIKIHDITEKTAQNRESLQRTYPTWKLLEDARLTAFTKLTAVLITAKFALVFASRGLLNDEWWNEHVEDAHLLPEREKGITWHNYMQFMKVGFTQFTFAGIESSFRIFLRAVDSTAGSGGTAEFKSIYDSLLRSKLSHEPADGIALLDLFRLVRNTIHNNGVYYHKSGRDEQVTYKGITYSFRIGKPIDFIDWDFILKLVDDARGLLFNVVTDDVLVRIPHIKDPNTD